VTPNFRDANWLHSLILQMRFGRGFSNLNGPLIPAFLANTRAPRPVVCCRE
jgi:hypothetical protein